MKKPIQKAVDALNAAFKADPQTIRNMLGVRFPCNGALGDHPTVQVQDSSAGLTVGFLGFLNGAIEPVTGQRIAAMYDKKGLVGFAIYKKQNP